ncbi:MAG TPA: hypothetical protein VGK49_05085 [Ilumatobacteraceae bacterium]
MSSTVSRGPARAATHQRSIAMTAVGAFVAVTVIIAAVAMRAGVGAGLAIVGAAAIGIWVGPPVGLALGRRMATTRTERPGMPVRS